MTSAHAARVRTHLLESGFTADGVLARVGSSAFAALGRGLTVPVRRALAEGAPAPVDPLIALFLLGDPVGPADLPADVAGDLAALGLVRPEPGGLVPLVEVHPYGEPDTDWYLVSDVGAPTAPDHVLGLGGASLTLARITPRRDVGRALDLGCGAGVQLLHAARHATVVVGTDTNPRALAMTALSAALSGIPADELDLRDGSLFGPVSDERFDLIVSNPPFVISPSHQFTYRDAGLPGDELSRLVVRGAAAHLAPGGTAAVLGNWLHVSGEQWVERVTEWVSGTGVAAWVVQQWLDAFADEQADQVGFGWLVLVAPSAQAESTWVHVEDLTHAERLPRGDEVEAFLGGCAAVEAMSAQQLLATRARLADGATVTTTSHVAVGAAVDAPPRLGLAGSVGPGGWRPAVTVPPALLAALLGPADTPIGERLDTAAQAEGLDPLDVLGPSLMGLRELVRVGIVRTD